MCLYVSSRQICRNRDTDICRNRDTDKFRRRPRRSWEILAKPKFGLRRTRVASYEIYPKLLLSCRNCLKIYSEFGYPFEKHDSHSSVILKNSQTETKCRCLSAAQLYLKENIYNCKVWHWNHPHKCKYLYSILICLLFSLQHLNYTQTRNDMKRLLKILCVCT